MAYLGGIGPCPPPLAEKKFNLDMLNFEKLAITTPRQAKLFIRIWHAPERISRYASACILQNTFDVSTFCVILCDRFCPLERKYGRSAWPEIFSGMSVGSSANDF